MVDVELYTNKATQLDEGRVRDDLFQLLGVPADGARDRSPLGSFRRRFPWLGCNLAAGILAAFFSSAYKDELNRVVALAFFIPVVLNLAESVSSQSVSLALQVLHGQPPSWKMIPGRLADELATGLMLGLAAGAAVGLVGLIWLGQARVALCLLGGICGGVAGAAMMGTALPFVLRLLRLEPRVAAGPIALAGADVITILLYLNLWRWLLRRPVTEGPQRDIVNCPHKAGGIRKIRINCPICLDRCHNPQCPLGLTHNVPSVSHNVPSVSLPRRR